MPTHMQTEIIVHKSRPQQLWDGRSFARFGRNFVKAKHTPAKMTEHSIRPRINMFWLTAASLETMADTKLAWKADTELPCGADMRLYKLKLA